MIFTYYPDIILVSIVLSNVVCLVNSSSLWASKWFLYGLKTIAKEVRKDAYLLL